jgi:hypothetical protein
MMKISSHLLFLSFLFLLLACALNPPQPAMGKLGIDAVDLSGKRVLMR